MPLPKETLDDILRDVRESEAALVDLKDVISDMRLSGMDVAKEEDKMDELTDKIRSLRSFYDRQKAKRDVIA